VPASGLEQLIFEALTQGSPPPTAAADRVYPVLAKETDPLPRVTYQRVSTEPQNGLGGHALIDRVQVQFDCWATTPLGAANLARQVRTALSSAPFKPTFTSQYDGFEGESRLFRHTLEMSCWDKTFEP
jgi:hypothetical protein